VSDPDGNRELNFINPDIIITGFCLSSWRLSLSDRLKSGQAGYIGSLSMKYCSECGVSVRLEIPTGDDRLRHVCNGCGRIHYHNPRIIAGCVPVWEGRVLLCRRAIEPRMGYWTLPAGFMELGETLSQAAKREAMEEAGIDVELHGLQSIFSLPQFSQVYTFHYAGMKDETHTAGIESLETRLFAEADIPWDALSFASVRRSLELYFNDRKLSLMPLHEETITKG
jgi:ADP-ribose pyrophosphatase YjhB (NUDIX family)